MDVENKKTLLLVEDAAIIALSQKRDLEKYGYTVIHSISGEKTLEIISSNNKINLILMDINLGSGMDGPKTARLILKKVDIPIVFLSSHTEKDVVETTEAISSYGYVVKNSGITVLDASIKMAFKLYEEKKKVEKEKIQMKQEINFRENLIQTEGVFFVIIKSDGKTVFVNQTMLNTLGYTTNEVSGKDYLEFFVPLEERIMLKEHFRIITEEQSVVRVENHILTKTGEKLLVDWRGNFIPSDSNSDVMFFGVGIDITDQKETEARLYTSEARFRSFMDHVPARIYIKNNQLQYTFANKSALKFIKLSSEELLGNTAMNLFPNTIAKELENIDLEVLNTGKAIEKVFKLKSINNEEHWTRDIKFPLFNKNGEFLIGSIAVDITDQVILQKSLEANEQMYRQLVENLGVGLFQSNVNGRFLFVNKALLNLLEYESLDEIINIPLWNIWVKSSDRDEYLETLKNQGSVNNYEVNTITKTGNILTLRLFSFIEQDLITGIVIDRSYLSGKINDTLIFEN
jgi:PAS domain S-box-containing protein